ncbi:MAG: hypothetical protein QOC87_1408 [Actinomycetota bacterium]|nr:hypothetical protein [Actinomycetota bacterium]
MISSCPRCGRSLQGLRVLSYDNVVMNSDGSQMIAACELAESTWRVFCSAGHDVSSGEVISLSIPTETHLAGESVDLTDDDQVDDSEPESIPGVN